MQRGFDWVDHDLLFHKLLQNNIDGYIYNAINVLYSHPKAKTWLNEAYTDWFDTTNGVKQRDSLSLTLLGIYINDLICEANQHNLGLQLLEYGSKIWGLKKI